MLLVLATVTAKLGNHTRALRRRVQMLGRISPICTLGKSIRDPHGDWHQMESYVTSRSEARFSHGVCACCSELNYSVVEPES